MASVSVDYVTRLEQGRGLRPSADVVDALARALHLDDDERTYLFDLAGHAPPSRQAPTDTVSSPAALVESLSPLPAMLVDHHFDIVAWNHPAFATLYRDRSRVMREGIADLRPLGNQGWRIYVYLAADDASQQTLDLIVR